MTEPWREAEQRVWGEWIELMNGGMPHRPDASNEADVRRYVAEAERTIELGPASGPTGGRMDVEEDPGHAGARAVLDRAAARINAATAGRALRPELVDMMTALMVEEADRAVAAGDLEPYLDRDGNHVRVHTGHATVEVDDHGLTLGLIYYHRMERRCLYRLYAFAD